MEFSITSSEILTAMITPAVLISASGTLVLSTSNRLSRVVDRVRVISDQLERYNVMTSPDSVRAAAKRELYLDQLARLSKRIMLLRSALMSLYTAIGLFVATSVAICIVTIMQWRYGWITVILSLVGAVTLLLSSLLLVAEARQAVTSTLRELDFVRRFTKTEIPVSIDPPV